MAVTLRLRDTLTRELVTIERPASGPLTVYACGPTIYNHQHVGNFRKFTLDDVLVRTLRHLGYETRFVMNITDVGHLVGDGDEGEDKIDVASRREGIDVEAVIEKYLASFEEEWRAHGLVQPEERPRASKYVPQQIELASLLVAKGHAYDTDEALYFDVASSPGYGALTGQAGDERLVGVRDEVVTETSKRNPADFALWLKRVGKFEHHLQHWDSPWGDGFPGWHLECSALAKEFLGHPVGIHTGGVDNVFPHHTNEIAQSEGAYGAPFAHAWLHAEHVLSDGVKMSKSLGNVVLPSDLRARGFSLADYRYLMLGTHYRARLNFTWESLEAARAGRRSLLAAYWHAPEGGAKDADLLERFDEALADDLATPRALAIMHEAARLPEMTRRATLEALDEVLRLLEPLPEIPQAVQDIVARREEARANEQFMQSDALREEARGLGYEIEDSPQGPRILPLTT